MPSLLMFAPCERVIIGQGDNSLSLIGVLHSLRILDPTTKEPLSPIFSWAALTMWKKEPGDEGVSFTQRVALHSPTDQILIESVTAFTVEKGWHRVVNLFRGLPLKETGTHLLKLSLRVGEAGEWREIAAFPLTIAAPLPATTPASSRTH